MVIVPFLLRSGLVSFPLLVQHFLCARFSLSEALLACRARLKGIPVMRSLQIKLTTSRLAQKLERKLATSLTPHVRNISDGNKYRDAGRPSPHANREIQSSASQSDVNSTRQVKEKPENKREQPNGYGWVGHVEHNGCNDGHFANVANF